MSVSWPGNAGFRDGTMAGRGLARRHAFARRAGAGTVCSGRLVQRQGRVVRRVGVQGPATTGAAARTPSAGACAGRARAPRAQRLRSRGHGLHQVTVPPRARLACDASTRRSSAAPGTPCWWPTTRSAASRLSSRACDGACLSWARRGTALPAATCRRCSPGAAPARRPSACWPIRA